MWETDLVVSVGAEGSTAEGWAVAGSPISAAERVVADLVRVDWEKVGWAARTGAGAELMAPGLGEEGLAGSGWVARVRGETG